MIAVDVSRVGRTLDRMLPTFDRPLRAGEKAAAQHVLRGDRDLLLSVAGAAAADGRPHVRAAAEALASAAGGIEAARSGVVKTTADADGRFDAHGVASVLTQARENVRRGAQLLGDIELPVVSTGYTATTPLDDLVPSMLARATDARYVDEPSHALQGSLRVASKLGLQRALGIHVIGGELVPRTGGFIVASNHSFGALDTLYVGRGHDRNLRFLAGGGYEGKPVIRTVFNAGGAMPLSSGEPARGMSIARAAIEQGQGVAMYPQGRTFRADYEGEARDGVAWLAHATGADVITAGVYGTRPGYTRGESGLRRPMAEVVFSGTVRAPVGDDSPEALTATRERIWQGVDQAVDTARENYRARRSS